jgi:hypothetical protein
MVIFVIFDGLIYPRRVFALVALCAEAPFDPPPGERYREPEATAAPAPPRPRPAHKSDARARADDDGFS